jgi:hypothetical protein
MSPESGKGFWEQDMRQNQEKTRLAGMTRFNVASSDSRKSSERLFRKELRFMYGNRPAGPSEKNKRSVLKCRAF